MTALAQDINEPDLKKLCDNTTWSVIGTDVVAKPTGCQQMVTFNDVGVRSVVVTTKDSEGLKSTQRIFINILPPLENPFPRKKHRESISSFLALDANDRPILANIDSEHCRYVNEPT